jgi:predicted nucleic acid-binding protein
VLVADTGAVVALLDRDDAHHAAVRSLFAANLDAWVLPWAILPEVDYLVSTRLGEQVQDAWLDDLARGAFAVEGGKADDLTLAHALIRRYGSLDLGLVDAVVMVIAERLGADIATVDLRHFGAVRLKHAPRLLPRDAAGFRSPLPGPRSSVPSPARRPRRR